MRALAVLAVVLAGSAGAQTPESAASCPAPDSAVYVDARLPSVQAALLAGGPLRVIVVGTASSTAKGVSRADRAYPARLEQDLRQRLAPRRVDVANLARPRWTAAEMIAAFAPEVIAEHPNLVIWQTGTTDAIQGIAPDEFGAALGSGIDQLQQHGVDVILMDMQYTPVSTTMINLAPYIEQMQWLTQIKDVLFFHRYDTMKHWVESGLLDFAKETRAEQLRQADMVHGCLALLLAEMIERAALKADQPTNTGAESEPSPGSIH
ncbi:MAG: SGNH/GDSL hydrolase family protein [Azospirillum sp.]|nr:SGNH/GDSL hydrolase family protein [Azospirillum sp.]